MLITILHEKSSSDGAKQIVTVQSIQEGVDQGKISISDLDEGARFMLEHLEYAGYTDAEARAVLRKIDWMLMPIMTLCITFAAADKILISNAAVYGMSTDVGLVGKQYSWLGSIFYFGYLITEIPATLLLQKFPVARVLCLAFVSWNIVLMCMAAGNNFASLAVMRFLLGMGESFLFPACSSITSMFYKKSEQPFRTAIWFSGFSSIVTGVLSYGVGHASSKIANWRLLFLVFGSITLFLTACLWIILPDSPMSCRWFDDREKYIALSRTAENRTGVRNTKLKRSQVIEALTDWKTWVMACFALCNNISNGGLVTFAAQIVSGLGYSPLRTTLLGMPTGVFMTFSSWLIASVTFVSPRKFRTIAAATVCLCPLICCILMKELDSSKKTGLLMAYYFFYFYWGPYVSMTAISYANTAGQTKKSIVNGINFTAYCVSNIIAPQFFITSEAPHYSTGYNAILGFTSAAFVCILLYAAGCCMENRRRDKMYGEAENNVDAEMDALDLTDKEKERFFRYVW